MCVIVPDGHARVDRRADEAPAAVGEASQAACARAAARHRRLEDTGIFSQVICCTDAIPLLIYLVTIKSYDSTTFAAVLNLVLLFDGTLLSTLLLDSRTLPSFLAHAFLLFAKQCDRYTVAVAFCIVVRTAVVSLLSFYHVLMNLFEKIQMF